MFHLLKAWLLKVSVGCLVWAFLASGSSAQQANRTIEFQVPEGVRVLRDLEYRNVQGKPLLLDLYLPEEGEGPFPVIVWVHGGAWRAGSKDRHPAAQLATAGYAIASINYRLSGEALFPAQIEDCKAALRWLRAHCGRWRIGWWSRCGRGVYNPGPGGGRRESIHLFASRSSGAVQSRP